MYHQISDSKVICAMNTERCRRFVSTAQSFWPQKSSLIYDTDALYEEMDPHASALSDDSTIPNTPEADSEDAVRLDEGEVFAWLRPLSDTAQKAFDATVNTVIRNKYKPDFDHTRHFLHCDSRQDLSRSFFTEDGETSYDQPQGASYRWVGAFGLRLTYLTHNPVQGWCLGTQCNQSPVKKVDLLLAPPKSHWKKARVASHHATLQFHTESCRISIQARHTTTIGGNGTKTFRHSEFCILEHEEIVFLGDCAYTFEYTDFFRSSAFDRAVTQYTRKYQEPLWYMNKHISPIMR